MEKRTKPTGHFVMKGATVTTIEASIYEDRFGRAESNLFSFVFDNKESFKVKGKFIVNVEDVEIKDEQEEGKVILQAEGGGWFQFLDEDQQILFEGNWRVDMGRTRLVVGNNVIVELRVVGDYSGVGKSYYAGNHISGQMTLELAELDGSGIGIYRIRGEGTIT